MQILCLEKAARIIFVSSGTHLLTSITAPRDVCIATNSQGGEGGTRQNQRATSLEDVPQSPGTPCSQCMREKANAEANNHQFPANNGIGLTSPLGK